ncbi:MAG: tRNA (uridine(34)/cytosine(34)/5-carboxymethylaminomethyluridine(34)-2'-O)-methyltransferase TrmL [Bacillota bacterium]|jgi:tRNA (cytidine/uridine-2'-O-)-methyltransferase
MSLNIVMVEPEIPQNTGNVARLCAAAGARLHLVRPFGFQLDSKHMKRAGLDYWEFVDIVTHDSLPEFMASLSSERFFLATTSGHHSYHDVQYRDGDYIMFGPESRGLPKEMLRTYPDQTIRIPMAKQRRSLNVANSAAIILYEALRQLDFPALIKSM